MRPVRIVNPEGTVTNARAPAAMAAGNVETSQRITDVVLGALARALPGRIPAASSGTMNNLTFGGYDRVRARPFAYYETIAGGAGAGPVGEGRGAVHTHMTNSWNTPVEAFEHQFPARIRSYKLRAGSGGAGRHRGGDGVIKEFEFLTPVEITLLSDRRTRGPYGLSGGQAGKAGTNSIREGGRTRRLPGKVKLEAGAGAVLRVKTPGGGGWG
jgi:N-methylhydantoinase B